MKKFLILLLFTTISFAQQKTFTNPILPSGADPYSTYYKGYYYYTNTLGNKLVLWKTKDLSDIKNAETLANETGAKIYKLDSGLTGETNNNAYMKLLIFIMYDIC